MGGRRYFYYTLKSKEANETESILKRLPTADVDDLVVDSLRRFFADSSSLADHLGRLNIQQMQLLSSAASEREALLGNIAPRFKRTRLGNGSRLLQAI